MKHKSILSVGVFILGAAAFFAESTFLAGGNALADNDSRSKDDLQADDHAQSTIDLGREIFRFDTFGDEAWWGDTLKLHQATAGTRNAGCGPGGGPRTALAAGLQVER